MINLLTSWFTDVGVPVTMTTDGGPQFKSTDFNTFCAEWGITHNVSSPYNHQSNGAAEAAVKSVKHLVTKCTKNGNLNSAVFKEGLLELRNTPKASAGVGVKPPTVYGSNILSAKNDGQFCGAHITIDHASASWFSDASFWIRPVYAREWVFRNQQ